MRDLLVLSPAGIFSVRKFLLFVATLVVTVFAYIFVSAPVAHAAGGEWRDGSIIYEGNTYAKYGGSLPAATADMPKGAQLYLYASDADKSATPQKAHIIWFEADTKPNEAKDAHYAYYSQVGDAEFENPTKKATVTFAVTGSEAGSATEDNTTSCVIEGIGWIICPITNFLSSAMDWLFGILQSFLTVPPVQTQQDSALYRGWSAMRNFANVAFIIGFLIIIYSQITSIGLSSYGIKRLLPRIIVAAILVNVSYWICAIAVDLSNIAGSSTYHILDGIRNDLVGPEGNNFQVDWKSLGGFILSGGAATAGISLAAYSAAAAGGAPIFMLLPVLVGILLAALVAILIMAARQALIVILIIIAPLAFVAYLLPNTEKYFEKWRDIFTTMLVLFPLFAGVVGGAQLAGDAIIQNAQGINSLNLIILGMAVKVAPVVVTPFLLKFSGSLLGKIAGIVNNPGKGLVDRTRNWSQERADAYKAKQLANTKNPNFMARAAQRIDANKRKRDGWKKANEGRADANWANSEAYRKIHGYDANTSQIKEIGENAANQHVAQMRATNAAAQGLDIRARASKLDLDVSQAKVEANWEAVKAGQPNDLVVMAAGITPSSNVVDAINRSPDASRDLALAAMRKQAAERVQTLERGTQLMNNTAMIDGQTIQEFAGGVDPSGAQRALADALGKQHAARGEAVKNANAIIEHNNATDDQIVELAKGRVPTGINIAMTDDVREAAIKRIASGKNIKAMVDMLDQLDISSLNENQQIALGEELKANGAKPKYVTATVSSRIAQGAQPLGTSGVNDMIKSAIEAGKYSAEVLATQDDAALQRVFKAIRANPGAYTQAAKDKLREQIDLAKNDDILKAKLGEREGALNDILSQL
ncbi:hypothetical protein PV379_03390 [Streptomyces caniscabiei]|uniref:hypothetical protein n=1 Tax=Streptomyces caniscabiei TaxID=2746961 RepID=UPI0029B22D82|nr:hypothetical protein [Streptomyces caniscabiei]MDX2776383.1 hypothetical protein [Streptomyces caniscabiei]